VSDSVTPLPTYAFVIGMGISCDEECGMGGGRCMRMKSCGSSSVEYLHYYRNGVVTVLLSICSATEMVW
jgi:hypothetical protein